jgi:CRP/FNR family transcriptional regulator
MKTIAYTDSDFLCDIQAPCFQLLSETELNLVKSSRTQVVFRKGDQLMKQGSFASYVLFAVSGLAKQYVENDHGKDFNLRIVLPGEFIGLPSIFSQKTFSSSVVALTECRAFLVETDVIVNLCRQNGDFAWRIISRYFDQNTDLFNYFRTITGKQMNGRLADTLLYLNGLKPNHPEIFTLLSRKDLGNFSDLSAESTVKLLKIFEREGIIKLDEKDIIVEDPEQLLKISKIG